MTRFSKTSNGKYSVKGHTYEILVGTRAQVWHGTAHKTSGGLTKKDLMQNKAGRIVSKAKHSTAKKEMRLVKAGYGTKKGQFGYVKLSRGKTRKMHGGNAPTGQVASTGTSQMATTNMKTNVGSVTQPVSTPMMKKGGSRSRRHKKGGMVNLPLSPSFYDGKGVGTSGVELQFIAGQGN